MIKEYCPISTNRIRCVIRVKNYAKTFAHINSLVEAAKKDFPFIKDEDIDVNVYGGDTIKRTMGIEFNVDANTPGVGHTLLMLYSKTSLEVTLN